MKRTEAREKVFQIIFQKEFYDDFENRYEQYAADMGLKGTQGEYALATIRGILENIDEIDNIIKNNLKNWTFERLPKPAVAILRLGVYELLYNDEVPDVTSIDEAVKLAYAYCDDSDSVFINGVLNKLYEEKKCGAGDRLQ